MAAGWLKRELFEQEGTEERRQTRSNSTIRDQLASTPASGNQLSFPFPFLFISQAVAGLTKSKHCPGRCVLWAFASLTAPAASGYCASPTPRTDYRRRVTDQLGRVV
jgi:hypothetical protein